MFADDFPQAASNSITDDSIADAFRGDKAGAKTMSILRG